MKPKTKFAFYSMCFNYKGNVMVKNVIVDTIKVNDVFMVDRRVTKINVTLYARRSTDEKSEMRPAGYQTIDFGQHGRIIDISV